MGDILAQPAHSPSVVLTLIHGIGFTKRGDLDPAMKALALSRSQVSVDANWNVIAAADYSETLTFRQLAKLFGALDRTACLRPTWIDLTERGEWLTESAIDLFDLVCTIIFWLLPVAGCFVLLSALYETRWDAPLVPVVREYVWLYPRLLGGATALAGLLWAVHAAPLTRARTIHVLIAILRPLIVLSYLYMVATNRRSYDNPFSILIVAFYLVGGACGAVFFLVADESMRIQLIALLLVAFLAGPQLVGALMAPALKLMLDILLYVSDDAYRTSILDALERQIGDASSQLERPTLVIIGHSLGSVIAADFVVSRLKPGQFSAITLVTAGSPISRMFQHIYPDHLIPRCHENIAKRAAACGNFKWLNYYRRFDGVGARLDLPSGQSFVEAVSPLISDPLRSHTGYWSEPEFHAFVADHWQRTSVRAD